MTMTKAQDIVNQIAEYYQISVGDILTISPRFHKHLHEDRGGFYGWNEGDNITITSIHPARDRADTPPPETPEFSISHNGGHTVMWLPDVLEMRQHKADLIRRAEWKLREAKL